MAKTTRKERIKAHQKTHRDFVHGKRAELLSQNFANVSLYQEAKFQAEQDIRISENNLDQAIESEINGPDVIDV